MLVHSERPASELDARPNLLWWSWPVGTSCAGPGLHRLRPQWPSHAGPRSDHASSTDGWFSLRTIQKLTRSFYRGIGLPIDEIWKRSDMLPRDGKHPHAFCIGIDNPRDVRVLCNLDNTARWMETTLHEFGHAVYDSGISQQLPWLLRHPAHTFITEAVAMFFGRMVRDRHWLVRVAGVPQERAALARQGLVEGQLYAAPGHDSLPVL